MLNISYLIATVFQIGYLPWMPGTWGTLFGYILASYCMDHLLWMTVVVGCIGTWASQKVAIRENIPDPSHVVIDEIFGFFLLVLAVNTLTPFINAVDLFFLFLLFRFFDIWKPWPIRQVETYFDQRPHLWGLGIMVDDVIAAVFSFFAWYALLYW